MIGPFDIYRNSPVPSAPAWISSNNPIETQQGDQLWVEFDISTIFPPDPTLPPPAVNVVMTVETGQFHGVALPGVSADYCNFGALSARDPIGGIGTHLIKISPGLFGTVAAPAVLTVPATATPSGTTQHHVQDVPPPWWGFAISKPLITLPNGETMEDPREYQVSARAYVYQE